MTVPRQDLRQTLGSSPLLHRSWPDHAREVTTLVHVLRIAEPSLAEALKTGLVSLDGDRQLPVTHVRLGHRSTRLTALALNESVGVAVNDAFEHPDQVTWLAIEDVSVAEALAS